VPRFWIALLAICLLCLIASIAIGAVQLAKA